MIYGALALVALALFALSRTKFALAVALVREDEHAARGVGVDVGTIRTLSLALGGAIAGLGGALYAHASFFITPTDFGFARMEQILVWCVVGGVTSPLGAVLGAALLSILPEAIRFLADYREITQRHHPARRDPVRTGRPRLALAPRRRARARLMPARARARDVGVRYGGVDALRGVSLAVEPGRVLGLIGPNGAGKTTLVNATTGLAPLASGTIALDGKRIDGLAPHRIARAGIARTYQNIRLFGALDVHANLAAGAFARPGRLTAAEIAALLERAGIPGIDLSRARGLAAVRRPAPPRDRARPGRRARRC